MHGRIVGVILILLVVGPILTFLISRKQRERAQALRELFGFLVRRKRYWMLPLVAVLAGIIVFIVVTATSPVWAAIYVGIFGAG